MDAIKNYLTDMDGVLLRGTTLIPGAIEFIQRLRIKDLPFLILTNNSQYTQRDLQVRLLGEERRFRGLSRRSGIYQALEDGLKTALYGSEEEAVAVLQERRQRMVPLDVLPPSDGGDARAEASQ